VHETRDGSLPGVRDQVGAALIAARQTGWDGLLAEQRSFLDDFWAHADVELDGDPELQQAVRFALFHVLQAGARAEGRAIPAKGLTGPGYNGHAFWDTETFVLPVLTYTAPAAAAHALRWRHSTLPMALERARQLGLAGAAFPWRTIRGEECSSYWPAGTAAFHVGADIADAVLRYVRATADIDFERTVGVELLVQTARLWQSLGHHDGRGRFCIDGVTGPDEYSAIADNNVYTNLMAQQNLHAAADVAARHPECARELDVDEQEIAAWRAAAEAMFVPYDDVLGVHPQSEGFTGHQEWDFASTAGADYPLLLHFPYFTFTASRWSSRPIWCSRCSCAGTRSPTRRSPQLRLLRAAHRTRLLPVGLHPSRHRRRGRTPRPRLRLPRRSHPHGPRRPRTQHPRRPAHRLAGGGLDRSGRRVRWHA
jgi:alpha,alpha-trehalose phosphorylase